MMQTSEEQYLQYKLKTLETATRIWNETKKNFGTEYFESLSDDERINEFYDKYYDFFKEFPIVSRYMVCMRLFSKKAFKDFLKKIENCPKQISSKSEDWWIERRADYVFYLLKELGNNHNMETLKNIRREVRDKLKEEFKNFERKYDNIEKKHKEDKKKYQYERLSELLNKIRTGDSNLSNESINLLIEKIEYAKINKFRILLLKEIREKVKLIEPLKNCETYGTYRFDEYSRNISTGMLYPYTEDEENKSEKNDA